MQKGTRDFSDEAAPQARRGPTPGTKHAIARRRLARRAPPAPEQTPWQSSVVRVSTVIAVWLGY